MSSRIPCSTSWSPGQWHRHRAIRSLRQQGRRAVTVALAAVLVTTGLAAVPAPAWAAPQFKGEQAQRYDAVRSAGTAKTPATAADPTEAAAKVTRPAPVWPAAASAVTDLAAEPLARSAAGVATLKAGSLPARVGAPRRGIRPAKVKVEVLSQTAARAIGVRRRQAPRSTSLCLVWTV